MPPARHDLDEIEVVDDLPPPIDLDTGDDGDDDHGEPIHWVTLATFVNSEWAHLARLRLEARDIPVFRADEHMGAMAWHYVLATGGIKLQVPAEQLDEAIAVLREPPPPSAPRAGDSDRTDGSGVCPSCGSADIRASLWTTRRILGLTIVCLIGLSVHLLAGVVVFAFAVTAVLRSRRHRCAACGSEFDDDPRRGFEVVIAPAETPFPAAPSTTPPPPSSR